MNPTRLHAAAFALTLGFATAASAGDFDFGHPDQDLLKLDRPAAAASTMPALTPEQKLAKQVSATAATLTRKAGERVSTEESRAMVGEDSGSFWLSQRPALSGSPAAVAQAESERR